VSTKPAPATSATKYCVCFDSPIFHLILIFIVGH
jgi:hypothetical protein